MGNIDIPFAHERTTAKENSAMNHAPFPNDAPITAPSPCFRGCRSGFRAVLVAWLLLCAVLTTIAAKNISAPGLYYDEAVCGHLAKDFLLGRTVPSLPSVERVDLFGRPFPLYVQVYSGALKCWMLLPSFALFGATTAVMRFTMLAWALLALLFFMLFAQRFLGTPGAILGGVLLAFDPAFFFTSVCEWGAVVPSFVCRCAGLFFVWRWWEERKTTWMFWAGLFFGLGLLNKLDFSVLLVAYGLAAVMAAPRACIEGIRSSARQGLVGIVGFLLGCSLVLWNMRPTLQCFLSGGASTTKEEWLQKKNTLIAMLDGSYFSRFIEHGRDIRHLMDLPTTAWSSSGIVFSLAFLVLAAIVLRRWKTGTLDRRLTFLLLGTILVLVGTWFFPHAVHIHHWTLVYPFPQLVIAVAIVRCWRVGGDIGTHRRMAARTVAIAAALIALAGNALAIHRTEQLIAATGGRGNWSNALDAFAAEVRGRSDLTIVSLDWGFHEQLAFLTDGPRLLEPTWWIIQGNRFDFIRRPNFLYLFHPETYETFSFNTSLLRTILRLPPQQVSVTPHLDRSGQVAFYVVQFFEN